MIIKIALLAALLAAWSVVMVYVGYSIGTDESEKSYLDLLWKYLELQDQLYRMNQEEET